MVMSHVLATTTSTLLLSATYSYSTSTKKLWTGTVNYPWTILTLWSLSLPLGSQWRVETCRLFTSLQAPVQIPWKSTSSAKSMQVSSYLALSSSPLHHMTTISNHHTTTTWLCLDCHMTIL